MYLKRQNINKFLPITKKGTKYLAMSSHNQRSSIPLIIALRDILKLVRTKKELKFVINKKEIQINGKEIRDTNYPISLFDILFIKSLNKNYRINLRTNKKIFFEEISDKEATQKIIKIIGKKILKNKKVQLNLIDGRNVIPNEKANIDDSVIFNFKENKIEKIIRLDKGKLVFVFKGKHAGEIGLVENIIERGGKKIIVISNKNKINVWVKNVIVIESK